MASRNLTRTKVRSVLAALGIVIGVVAIASLGMLGASLRQQATQDLGSIGDQLVVYPSSDSGEYEPLTDREVREIERVATGATVVPLRRQQHSVSFGRQESHMSVYRMAKPGAPYSANMGRVPDPLRSGALVGSETAEQFDLEPGNTIAVNGSTYRVRAVLEEQSSYSPVDPNDAIILPFDHSNRNYSQVIVEAASGQDANATAMSIKGQLNQRERTVSVFEMSSYTEQINSFFGFLNVFLLGVGSISLLVAGVSILNVMLMSTVERREEIGVLRAVGFQKRDVLKIMLTEAALLGVFGGVVGTVLSVGIGALVANVAIQDPSIVLDASNLQYLALAFGFGVGTSVLSGLYPAWKAANEHPVEALRG
ncbi:ABC transporter permease [Halorientalis brevis]|uniref:ABC transporter permease n=1 Tax=Halorientalis brevis TaxID=1126241 RepID=A0ABD6CGR6_9EURY|nr:ABC transporter permease [Halorientalis brevis]